MSDENTALEGAIDNAVEESTTESPELELAEDSSSEEISEEGVQAETAEELQAEVEEAIEAGEKMLAEA